MAVIDLITTNDYFLYEERDNLTSSPVAFKKSSIEQFITQASSYAERFCNRPFVAASEMSSPVDMNGDALTMYAVYDSIETVPSPTVRPLPDEVQLAVNLLTRWYRFQAEHLGMSGQSSEDKTKSYSLRYFHQAEEILKRYKYYKPLDRLAQDLGDDYNLQGGIDS